MTNGMSIEAWSAFADEQGNVSCLRVAYPWQLLTNFQSWAQNFDLDPQLGKEITPYLNQFLEENALEWDDERCGQISPQNFVAYYVHGSRLITPAACYKSIGMAHERIVLPLAVIPLTKV